MSEIPPTRRGYDAFEVVSSLQKAIRRSQVQEAVYWAFELQQSGMANWCWKRLRVIVSEDIGQAAPGLAADVRALYENWRQDNKGEIDTMANLYLAHAVIACALAPKSRLVDWCLTWNNSDWTERLEVPPEALDGHTRRGKQIGQGHTAFFMEEATKLIDFDGDTEELSEDYHERLKKLVADGLVHPFRGQPDAPNPWPWRPPRERRRNGESWLPEQGEQQKLDEGER